jgi:hypothetical protein
VGDTISRIIEEQRRLESRYETLIAQRGVLKGLANKSKYKENQHEIQEVSRALRESTKNLCRNLKDNPNISGNLLKIQQEREDLQELLDRTLDELKEDGTKGRGHRGAHGAHGAQGHMGRRINEPLFTHCRALHPPYTSTLHPFCTACVVCVCVCVCGV